MVLVLEGILKFILFQEYTLLIPLATVIKRMQKISQQGIKEKRFSVCPLYS